ncbi:hypothetical protein VNI00_011266 [Paramarasmius palmivorus]|uniref:Uncharacterized protein n=1 Tax=Paramarasmius palmivorus TaxID=297713 RepID=A0AAW0CE83_9AGAR
MQVAGASFTAECDIARCVQYAYRLRPIAIDAPLSIVSLDGARQRYQSPFEDIPHFRSSASILLVLSNAARTLHDQIVEPFQNILEVGVLDISGQWYAPPATFAQKPNWQDLTHPFERTHNPIRDILDPQEEGPVPDLTPDIFSSTLESSLDTELALHPTEWLQNPGIKRWTRWTKKIIDRNLPFEEEVTNDKQLESSAKERCRS